MKLKVVDVMASGQIKECASVLQSKPQKPVRFEFSEGTRASLARWMREPLMVGSQYLWLGGQRLRHACDATRCPIPRR